jgi:hypothetical protein
LCNFTYATKKRGIERKIRLYWPANLLMPAGSINGGHEQLKLQLVWISL